MQTADAKEQSSRPARALWVEMVFVTLNVYGCGCRGPRGPCGLKSAINCGIEAIKSSRLARALWVEIAYQENNADLAGIYGNDLTAYYSYYMSCGHLEGRICH